MWRKSLGRAGSINFKKSTQSFFSAQTSSVRTFRMAASGGGKDLLSGRQKTGECRDGAADRADSLGEALLETISAAATFWYAKR